MPMGIVDINPFFGKIAHMRIKKRKPDDARALTERASVKFERALLEILVGDAEPPFDVFVVPRTNWIEDLSDEARRDALEQERVDIVATIQRLLRELDCSA